MTRLLSNLHGKKLIKRNKNYLKALIKTASESKLLTKNTPNPGIIISVPIKCPYCKSRKVRCYGADKPVLYYRCWEIKCRKKFKVIEKESIEAADSALLNA
jgi:hypothetical protein